MPWSPALSFKSNKPASFCFNVALSNPDPHTPATPLPNPVQNRRRFLQSSTALIALPFLESLGFRRFAGAAEPVAPPKRLLFLSFGWGVTESTWYPDISKTGKDYELPPGLAPLERHKADFSVVQGLWNK